MQFRRTSAYSINRGALVYFSSDDGNLYAVDITTSQERWRFTVEEGSLSSPALVDGMVYFGTSDGYL